MRSALQTIFSGKTLSLSEARAAMERILDGQVAPEQVAALLGALQARGETADEVTGFAQAILGRAVRVQPSAGGGPLVDCCGTGGDGTDTFNISTTVAWVLAGAGARVAKHGNRSVSSRCGSADVLEALGVAVDLDAGAAAQAMADTGFAFLFAPRFHPVLAQVAAIRRAIGVRTVFNLLGPLLNPAGARHQLVGVYDEKYHGALAQALAAVGVQEAFVVTGYVDGEPSLRLDEVSLSGPTRAVRLRDGRMESLELNPEDFGVARAPLLALKGGDAAENARLLLQVLEGEAGPRREIVRMNAAVALVAAGMAGDFMEGMRRAAESIDSGRACEALRKAAAPGRRS